MASRSSVGSGRESICNVIVMSGWDQTIRAMVSAASGRAKPRMGRVGRPGRGRAKLGGPSRAILPPVGQLLLVQSDAAGAARPVYERALELFRSVLGIDAHDAMADRRLAVAKFPRLNGPGSKIQRPDRGRFKVAAGTWAGNGGGDLRQALEGMDGLFFVAEGDADAITCATDRGGRLHVYGTEIQGCTVLATSALVLAALIDAPLDPLACQEMLGTGSVFEDRSLFQGV